MNNQHFDIKQIENKRGEFKKEICIKCQYYKFIDSFNNYTCIESDDYSNNCFINYINNDNKELKEKLFWLKKELEN